MKFVRTRRDDRGATVFSASDVIMACTGRSRAYCASAWRRCATVVLGRLDEVEVGFDVARGVHNTPFVSLNVARVLVKRYASVACASKVLRALGWALMRTANSQPKHNATNPAVC